MKHYIIDANNLIYKIPRLLKNAKSDFSITVSLLIALIKEYHAKYPSYKFTLVFDNVFVHPSHPDNIMLVSAIEGNADNEIKKIIRGMNCNSNIIIVSSDNEVFSYGRINACDVMTSDSFAKLLKAYDYSERLPHTKTVNEKPIKASKREIEEYKKLFGEID